MVSPTNAQDERTPPDPPGHPRRYGPDIPATGAWLEGDPPGDRRFTSVNGGGRLALEGGAVLDDVRMAYETWGELDADGANAVLVCHALTGDSHAAGASGSGHPTAGWWSSLIGPGRAIDTDRYFVVCVNVLGGCQGSTGPASTDPATGRPYGSSFPTVTIRDMVRAQACVADDLGVERWLTVIGGSMGGMQVLEWGVMFPDRVRSLIPVASAMAASPLQIGWSAVGRTALALDPRFRGGDYYDAAPGDGPHVGLAIARAVAQITYRSDEVFQQRFDRELVDPRQVYGLWDRFQVESYLDYHGEKLARRFDANSYLRLNRAMDLHDLARDRGGFEFVTRRLARVPVLTAAVTSDTLYPPRQQVALRDAVVGVGGRCELLMIDSPHGHDGFLLETEQLARAVTPFLDEVKAT